MTARGRNLEKNEFLTSWWKTKGWARKRFFRSPRIIPNCTPMCMISCTDGKERQGLNKRVKSLNWGRQLFFFYSWWINKGKSHRLRNEEHWRTLPVRFFRFRFVSSSGSHVYLHSSASSSSAASASFSFIRLLAGFGFSFLKWRAFALQGHRWRLMSPSNFYNFVGRRSTEARIVSEVR